MHGWLESACSDWPVILPFGGTCGLKLTLVEKPAEVHVESACDVFVFMNCGTSHMGVGVGEGESVGAGVDVAVGDGVAVGTAL